MSERDAIEKLPQAIRSETMDFLGYKLVAHVLDDGRRVFEDTPELRRLLTDMRSDVDPESLGTASGGAKE